MVRAAQTSDVASVFDQRVLEAAAGSQKRATAFAGKTDGIERAGHILVRARRHDPDASGAAEIARWISEFASVIPPPGGVCSYRRLCEFERPRDCLVGQNLVRVVTNKGDGYRACHDS